MSIRSTGLVVVVSLAALVVACGGDAVGATGGETEDASVADGAVSDAGTPEDAASQSDAGVLPDLWIVGNDDDASVSEADAAVEEDSGAVDEVDAGTETDVPDGSVVLSDAGSDPGCSLVFYRDADADGFGDPSASVTACAKPAGYVVDHTDCYDGNKLARPTQLGRFSVHRGDGSFDYDCDGVLSPRESGVAQCPPDLATATCSPWPYHTASEHCDYDAQVAPWRVLQEGWYQQVAACGEVGLWSIQLNWDNPTRTYSCSAPTTSQRQSCR